jgi:hypothetical protein
VDPCGYVDHAGSCEGEVVVSAEEIVVEVPVVNHHVCERDNKLDMEMGVSTGTPSNTSSPSIVVNGMSISSNIVTRLIVCVLPKSASVSIALTMGPKLKDTTLKMFSSSNRYLL